MKIFGAISTKLAVVTITLGGLVGLTAYTSLSVFEEVSGLTGAVSSNTIPRLRAGFDSSTGVNAVNSGLLEIVLADNASALTSASEHALAGLAELSRATDEEAEIGKIQALLVDVTESRIAELEATDALNAQLGSLDTAIHLLIEEIRLIDEETIVTANESAASLAEVIGSDIDRLVYTEASAMRVALQVKAEFNRAAGFSLALRHVRDPAIGKIFRDLAQTSLIRLDRMMPRLLSFELTASSHPAVSEAAAEITALLSASEMIGTPKSLHGFDDTDIALANAIDDALFSLAIFAEDMVGRSRTLLEEELPEQFSMLKRLVEVDGAIAQFLATALDASHSPDEEATRRSGAELQSAAERLQAAADELSGEKLEQLPAVLAVADSQDGVIAKRVAYLAARQDAEQSARIAFSAIRALTTAALEDGEEVLADTDLEIEELATQVQRAKTAMLSISIVCAVLFVLAQGAIFILVSRPIRTITRQTERLAAGDVGEIADLHVHGGEIAQLNKALHVFRQGLIDRARMEKEAHAHEEQQRRAERETEEQRLKLEAANRKREEDAAAERRRAEAAEQAAREDSRLEAERERRALMDRQMAVVGALANGLHELASGNLACTLDSGFPEDYEQLRQDFNSTVNALSEAMEQIVVISNDVGSQSRLIAGAIRKVSHRSEAAAASLEQSSAALEELTASVGSTADAASAADTLASQMSDRAEEGGRIVDQTKEAMARIEESSQKVGKITKVIDDIAFQTNLLALNAGVEAARAGDAGRGFAVVASEVRSLAQRASESASEIDSLISGSAEDVVRGVVLVGDTGDALEEMVTSVREIAGEVSQIARSASEQATTVSELNASVSTLDSATQENAAIFSETREATDILAQKAVDLTKEMSRFDTGRSSYSTSKRKDRELPDTQSPAGVVRKAGNAPAVRDTFAPAMSSSNG